MFLLKDAGLDTKTFTNVVRMGLKLDIKNSKKFFKVSEVGSKEI